MTLKTTLLTVALLVSSASAFAQDEEYAWNPNWFVGVQGGVQAQPLDGNLSKLYTPHFGLHVGRWFNNSFGMRIQGLASLQKGKLLDDFKANAAGEDEYSQYKVWSAKWDLMFNMTNIFWPNRQSQHFNWNLFGGFGANGAWGTQKAANETVAPYVGLGTQFEYLITKNFGVSLEVQANYRDNLNKSVVEGDGWQGVALFGLTYHFGHKKAAKAVAAPTTTVNDYTAQNNDAELAAAAARKAQAEELARAEAARKAAEAKKAAEAAQTAKAVVKDEPLKETIFYQISSADANNSPVLDKVASWAKKYPAKKVVVSGYADKGTGTAPVNMKMSQQRVNNVVKALKAKGVPAAQITTKAYGDTAQPYSENDQNRCTIVVGE